MIELLHGDVVRVLHGDAQGQVGTVETRWGWWHKPSVPLYMVRLRGGVRPIRQDYLERVTA